MTIATNHTTLTVDKNITHGRVLIIGGAGYIGLAVTSELLSVGFKISILDNLIHGLEPLDFIKSHPEVNFIKGDIRDIGLVNRTIEGHQAVIILAALVGQPACDLDPSGALEINYLATLNIVEACRRHKIERLVFTSTDSCYGTREGEKLDELSVLKPISLYAELKAQVEDKILSAPKTQGLSPVILRLATVYGISPRPRFDLAVNLLVREITLKGKATIFSGEQWRPLVHVSDVAKAFRLTLEAPANLVDYQIFNVGSNEQNIQFKDLGLLLLTLRPDSTVTFEPADPDLRDYFVKFEKIKKILNFIPSLSIFDGILEIHDSLKNGFPADPYDPKWRNV
jgi:nucleoside-diphosphate-sugar epimerase